MQIQDTPARIAVATLLLLASIPAAAGVLQVEDLNASQIEALDKKRTVVILVGGILESHGPNLPSYTDGLLSARLASDVANAAGSLPGWTALVFPQIPLGSSGANDIGGKYIFPGTYTLRSATLRAVYLDLASQLGEAGFLHVLVVHLHGAPLQNRVLDQASDYFRDVYSGNMHHLYGRMSVVNAWRAGGPTVSDAARKADGYCVHVCIDETSLMLYVQPDLVDPRHRNAPPWTGGSIADLRDLAARPDWPGYFGAPQFANPETGKVVYESISSAMVEAALAALDGKPDPATKRYSDVAASDPVENEIDRAALQFDERIRLQQDAWLRARGLTPDEVVPVK